MCTAATYQTKDFYMGRTLDYEFSYGEEITITPRYYPFHFKHGAVLEDHYAMIGMAHVAENYPLYYEGGNEKGLAMAGLNFVGNAAYGHPMDDKDNIAVYELIPWLLGQCASVADVRKLVKTLNIVDTVFSPQFPNAQLHWLIADANEAITMECMKDGLHIYDNPVGVMTNNPPFDKQLFRLNDYMALSPKQPSNNFSDKLDLGSYSRGMGALGLPGDLSSSSRFVRAAFVKMNALSGNSEVESVNQVFHIMGSVEQQRGCCEVSEGHYEITIYTACMNVSKGIYYYTTYTNHQITAVDMQKENLNGEMLVRYPMLQEEKILIQN